MNNYKEQELTISFLKAQLSAVLYFIPFFILFYFSYNYLWGSKFKTDDFTGIKNSISGVSVLYTIGIIILGVVLHELIHGATWAIFAKKGFKAIRFGIVWKFIAPYCHCNEPLLGKHYIIGGLMPGFIMGILPCIFALITGQASWLAFGLFFTMAAGGDFMLVHLLLKQNKSFLVQDHPSKIGCVLYIPSQL